MRHLYAAWLRLRIADTRWCLDTLQRRFPCHQDITMLHQRLTNLQQRLRNCNGKS